MSFHKTKGLLLFSFGCLLFLCFACATYAQEPPVEEQIPATEIEAVIKTLDDPVAREKLIQQLNVLLQAQQPSIPESQVKSAASQTLLGISQRLKALTESIVVLTGNINNLPEVISWVQSELADPQARQIWGEVLVNLALTLGLGYLAFLLSLWGLIRFKRSAATKSVGEHWLAKLMQLLAILVLDCLPILVFALTAYLTLGLVGPRELTRLVALAWINAFIIVHAIVVILYFIFAPLSSGLRFSGLSDETSNYLVIWGKRLCYVSVYGYFSLQAALLLGFPSLFYQVILRLLGLLVAFLVIVMILQNRNGVASYLLYWPAEKNDQSVIRNSGVRYRLTGIWHLAAIFYVVLFYGVWALQSEGGYLFMFRATFLTLLVLGCVRLLLRAFTLLFTRGVKVDEDLQSRFPGLEERSNRYLQTLLRALIVIIYLLGLLAILQAWGMNTFGWLSSDSGRILGGTLLTVFSILLVAFVIWAIACSLIEGQLANKIEQGTQSEVSARTRTLLAVARKALAIVLIVVTTLMVLAQLGVEIAPLLAGAGVLGLAVGFGSQKLVQDVITGIFILLEDQIAVGDVVNVGDKGGLVESVSIRTVRLRDLSGTVHTIPFSAINIVSNLTKDFSYYLMEVGVAYRENLDEVMQVLRDLGAELQLDEEYGPNILDPLEVLGVDAFADSAIIIKARIKTIPIKQWWVGREFNRRMKKRFDELGIEIPFPHTTVYFGENKGGGAPPALLKIEPVADDKIFPLKSATDCSE
ncbi:Small-conductance mechanosensitive channel [Malonomonas rubra DSM 5091]|uniref:Small-conductance mechanosensitive channel n=1 Tax=Malonomonas rubra DSM 5091 TaxID=1122189 RepID=A0A1M6KQP3_MALRU|nr:mechanosensitive ion channel domain-containing protein [Malonomonas rubra]SHJ61293.1 Small-conductance mechanosensitive channel [Malonomonas rubra DSM 5091]